MSEIGPRRIAIVGIDGCGKSTVLRRLAVLVEVPPIVIHCPNYHENRDAPLGGLSADLDAFSKTADLLGSFELKTVALFLQMTLFGPVESAMIEAFRPSVLLQERHPLVDSLAYGSFYSKSLRGNANPAAMEHEVRRRMGATFDSVLRWVRSENTRLGQDLGLWNLAEYVSTLFALGPAELISRLSVHYRTRLPDVVILLDLDAASAARRIGARNGATQELHEKPAVLEMLRQSYHQTIKRLPTLSPGIETHVVSTESEGEMDRVVHNVIAHGGL